VRVGETVRVPPRPLVLIALSGGPRSGAVQWCSLDPDYDLAFDSDPPTHYRRSDPVRYQSSEYGPALVLEYVDRFTSP
jgi:hypothetical protein